MKQNEIFGSAIWVKAANEENNFPILRARFNVNGVKRAILNVLGMGTFHCYVNGIRVSDELFLPLNTDYEQRLNYPPEEIMSGHRIYVPQYDITSMLKDGDNTIAIHFGGGWYTYFKAAFGKQKAIWRISGTAQNGNFDFCSSKSDKIGDSFVKISDFTFKEVHNYELCSTAAFGCDFDDNGWENAAEADQIDTEYEFCNCPVDRVCEILKPVCLGKSNDTTIYDCGINTSGYPVFRVSASKSAKVRIVFSEEITDDGSLDMKHCYEQTFEVTNDGTVREVKPLFMWYGFRYFSVTGDAEPLRIEVVHSDIKVISSFKTDNEILNWLNDTYLNTQLTNMHAGIPSDCPHIEKRGYTGDGQLTCNAVMDMLDVKSFYKKWIQDIADSQDKASGHIQYTAPYTRCGGGPGGWGCAIVEVPYQYYLHYGETDILSKYYPAMLRYFDYLESHSYGKLITRDKEGEWCLGDWCTPIQVVLPAPFVNNYFYIKSLYRTIEIAGLIGKQQDIPIFEKRIAERKEAIVNAYYNSWDGNFIGNLQGANAFAADIGLGDERTYTNLVKYYEKLGHFDTGIFGTDIVTRILFEHGNSQLAVNLLTSDDTFSYDKMRRLGATTIWEYWPQSRRDRSHNHPMFGAVTAYFYDYLVGIRNREGTAGYHDIIISPAVVSQINNLSGERSLAKGKVSVSYEKKSDCISFCIVIPEGQSAEFYYKDCSYKLTTGENRFTFDFE